MPLNDFIDKFEYDPATFKFDEFKNKIAAEFAADEQLRTAKVSELEKAVGENARTITQLKADKYDLLMKSGTPVTPVDPTTPTAPAGEDDGVLPLSAAFKTPEIKE